MLSTISTLCLYWAFAILLGISVGWNIAFVCMCVWSIIIVIKSG